MDIPRSIELSEEMQHLAKIATSCRAVVDGRLSDKHPKLHFEAEGRKVTLSKFGTDYTINILGLSGDSLSFAFTNSEQDGLRVYFRSDEEGKTVSCICDVHPTQDISRIMPSEIMILKCEELLQMILKNQANDSQVNMAA